MQWQSFSLAVCRPDTIGSQAGPFFGVQGDFAGLDVKGTVPCVVILSCATKSDWLATVSAASVA